MDAVGWLALITGRTGISPARAAQGYLYEPDKFAAGLTEQPSELLSPLLVAA
ncbi:hypothetical protein [Kitasatospora sp. NPDC015120]|uniref:hypothetical protein n=1 Tax=Kitasatospora sp. NPDC015120 TaxID=3364023 RepID=UPI0036F47474